MHGVGSGVEGGRVIAMLPDHDDAVDRELGAAAAQGQVDRGVDRHPVLLGQLLADVARAPCCKVSGAGWEARGWGRVHGPSSSGSPSGIWSM